MEQLQDAGKMRFEAAYDRRKSANHNLQILSFLKRSTAQAKVNS